MTDGWFTAVAGLMFNRSNGRDWRVILLPLRRRCVTCAVCSIFSLPSGLKSQNRKTMSNSSSISSFVLRPSVRSNKTVRPKSPVSLLCLHHFWVHMTTLARRIARPCEVFGDGTTLRRLIKLSDAQNVAQGDAKPKVFAKCTVLRAGESPRLDESVRT